MPLTQFAIVNAAPKDKPYKLADGGGLYLLIQSNGSKLWRLRYRFNGQENMLAFGTFPSTSLASARTKREEARSLLASGMNPSVKRKLDKIAAATAARNTFGDVAAEHLANLEANGTAATTMKKNRWMLQKLCTPIAKRPIADITAAEILDLLKKVEKSGRRETATSLRGKIGSVFRYGVVTLRATTDPTYALRGALLKVKVTHRAAIIDELQLGALMRSVDEYDGWPTLRAALQLIALTMTRPGELRGMKRNEINFDKAIWRIPAERMKMRRPHDVPLSKQALTIIKDIWPLSENGELVLPSIRSLDRPLSENAMNSALRRMGYSQEEMTAHGFRSSASTILNERGFNPDVIEAALAHVDDNEIRRAYNRAKYLAERTKLMQDWADLLDIFRHQSAAPRRAA
jgi:integrase